MIRLSFAHPVDERHHRHMFPGVLDAAEDDGNGGYLFDEPPPTDGLNMIVEEIE